MRPEHLFVLSRLLLTSLLGAGLVTAGTIALLPVPQAATAVSPPRALSQLPEPASAVTVRSADVAPYLITPKRKALLDTIRFAEGTWTEGEEEGYRMLYGGQLFKNLKRHPEITVRRRYTSAAAGAYQFLPTTWHSVARQLQLKSFEPHNQDQAALHLIKRRGALQQFDHSGLTTEVMAKLAPEWSSLPSWNGGSYYGQPVKSRGELLAFYQGALQRRGSTAS
jgi:muramidase (phage lysozyme)